MEKFTVLIEARPFCAFDNVPMDQLKDSGMTLIDMRGAGVKDPKFVEALKQADAILCGNDLVVNDAVLDLASRAVAANPDEPGVLEGYSWALYRIGRFREALENIDKSLASTGMKHSFLSAMCLWQLGRRAEARMHYEKAVAFMEEHGMAHPTDALLREETAQLLSIED